MPSACRRGDEVVEQSFSTEESQEPSEGAGG
jgi:hypothetical protein